MTLGSEVVTFRACSLFPPQNVQKQIFRTHLNMKVNPFLGGPSVPGGTRMVSCYPNGIPAESQPRTSRPL